MKDKSFIQHAQKKYVLFNGGIDECLNVKIVELKSHLLGKHGRWLVAQTMKEKKLN